MTVFTLPAPFRCVDNVKKLIEYALPVTRKDIEASFQLFANVEAGLRPSRTLDKSFGSLTSKSFKIPRDATIPNHVSHIIRMEEAEPAEYKGGSP